MLSYQPKLKRDRLHGADAQRPCADPIAVDVALASVVNIGDRQQHTVEQSEHRESLRDNRRWLHLEGY